MPIANYTTTVSVDKSVGEIQKMLAKAGARRVLTEYDETGELTGISFQLEISHTTVAFRLPANVAGVESALIAQRAESRYRKPDQYRRVAWRIIRDWLRAQLALVEAEQATLAQLMLPHAITPSGRTLSEDLEARGPTHLLLESEG